jgi:thymidine kinase
MTYKLYFRHGTMNSSKTANLLMVAHNYRSQGKNVLLLKPNIDTRFGDNVIKSRVGIEMKVDYILEDGKDFKITDHYCEDIFCLLVDECQWLTPEHVEQLRKLTEYFPVICYGLKSDYRTQLFSGSKRLLELADTIEEIKTICVKCDKKATINAKFRIDKELEKNGLCKIHPTFCRVVIRDGTNEPDLGAEEKYQPMCWKCWSK